MNIIKQLQWEIRQSYIKTLLNAGVNPKFLQTELPHLSNELMADLIRAMRRLDELK